MLRSLLEYDEPQEEAEIEFIAIILKRMEDGKKITDAEKNRVEEIYAKYIG